MQGVFYPFKSNSFATAALAEVCGSRLLLFIFHCVTLLQHDNIE